MNQEKKLSLKKAVIQKIEQERLSQDEVHELLGIQTHNTQTPGEPQAGVTKPSGFIFKQAATLKVIAASIGLILGFWFVQPQVSNHQPQTIAAEVAKNHLKLKPPDIEANNLKQLKLYFTDLDFRLSPSQIFDVESRLLGGRYCSIMGVTAAQLRLQSQHQAKGISTFYQVAYDAKHFGKIPSVELGEKPLTQLSKGLKIQLWVEKGLLMVLVEE